MMPEEIEMNPGENKYPTTAMGLMVNPFPKKKAKKKGKKKKKWKPSHTDTYSHTFTRSKLLNKHFLIY